MMKKYRIGVYLIICVMIALRIWSVNRSFPDSKVNEVSKGEVLKLGDYNVPKSQQQLSAYRQLLQTTSELEAFAIHVF